jgi:hypothetical protein
MKWTNREHQTDDIGEHLKNIEQIYIWGMGRNGLACLEFLGWLKEFADFTVIPIDSDKTKHGTFVNGCVIREPQTLFDEYNHVTSVVCVSPTASDGIMRCLEENGIVNRFTWISKYNTRTNFIQNFIGIWLLHKHNKLIHHWAEFITSNKCNLNCRGCLNFTSHITRYWEASFDDFKKHVDVFFSKYDYAFAFHFSGGEPLLCNDLSLMISYLSERYKERIYREVFFITNGTMLPDENLLCVLRECKILVQIDDYSDNIPYAKRNINELIDLLQKNGVKYQRLYTDHWFDVDIESADYFALSEDAMITHRDNCNTMFQTFNNGKIYSCCYPEYAKNSQAVPERESEGLDIGKASKAELLEYGLGYTESGYVGMCRHCNGLGDDAKLIPCAEQLPRGQAQ